MHQYGYGVDKDLKTSHRYYKKAENHPKALQKCGDFYYSKNDKNSAMLCYTKAAENGETSSLNNIGLMLE